MTNAATERRAQAKAKRAEIVDGWYVCRCGARRVAVEAESAEQAASLMASFNRSKIANVFVGQAKRITLPRKGETFLKQDPDNAGDWTKYVFATRN